MNKPPGLLISAMVLAMIVAGGCKKDESALPAKNSSPAADPRGAAKNMFTLLFDGTRAQFLSCFNGNDSDLNAVGIMFDCNRTSMDFRDAFIKTYGKAVWDHSGTGSGDPASQKRLILDEIATSELTIDGDQAVLANKNPRSPDQAPLRLVKLGDGWRVQAFSLRPAGENGDKVLAVMAKLASITIKYQKAIGKPGIKPEDISYELIRESNEQLGKTTHEPHRFDINKIK